MFKRALLIASFAAAFAAPALAEVNIYGSLRTGVEVSSVSGDNSIDRVRLIDESSRIGFKGSDKLDNGMTLFWKSEHRIRAGSVKADGRLDAGEAWGDRDSYVGIESQAGTFTFGKQYSAFGDWTLFSPVLDGVASNSEDSALYMWWDTSARVNNVAKYVSPTFSGFQLSASYDFGSKMPAEGTTPAYNNRGYSTLLTWSNDKFNFGGAYQRYSDPKMNGIYQTSAVAEAYALGGGIKLSDALTISAHWERARNMGDGFFRRDDYGIGANYAAGKWSFNTMYLKARDSKNDDGSSNDDGAYQFNLGARYALSKRTSALANYTYFKGDANSPFTTYTNVGGAGQRAHVFSVGVRTDF